MSQSLWLEITNQRNLSVIQENKNAADMQITLDVDVHTTRVSQKLTS